MYSLCVHKHTGIIWPLPVHFIVIMDILIDINNVVGIGILVALNASWHGRFHSEMSPYSRQNLV